MSLARNSLTSLACCAFAFAAGCDRGLPIAPASGTLSLNGQPLANANITTQPIGAGTPNPGPGSFATSDSQGHFELELVKPARKGAIIGQHRLMISPPNTTPQNDSTQVTSSGITVFTDTPKSNRAAVPTSWPTSFNDGSLTLEIPAAGSDSLRIDLKK
ncbi:MAG: hypothetical protein IT425_07780 [Pirellulales bacterium]|nr:hypothetical protein [Pirellulales bacterium]